MAQSDKVQWLRQETLLRSQPDSVLTAIADAMVEETVQANRRLVLEDTLPNALYILRQGYLERYRTTQASLAPVTNLLPGAVIYLKELLLDQAAEHTVVTLTDCTLWTIPRAAFLTLAEQYPTISQVITRQLAAALDEVSAQLAYEQERQAELRPYMPNGCGRKLSRHQRKLRKIGGTTS